MRYYLDKSAKSLVFEAPRGGDAGYDIRAAKRVCIDPGTQVHVPTGLHVAIPAGHVGLLRDRSSWGSLRVYLHGGVIDSSYRGEIVILLENAANSPLTIQPGTRIAQMIVAPCYTEPAVLVGDIADLGATPRGASGFGSTGD